MKVVITGGSGFLGTCLGLDLSKRGHEVVLISRSFPKKNEGWKEVRWDAQHLGDWVQELDGADAIVNLAGRTVDCIKTPDHCDEILRSRVETTRLVGRALREIKTPPSVWVQMSTAHLYGDPPTTWCDEDSPFGWGLAPDVGQAWEKAYQESVLPEMRQVILRTSFVVGRSGGALPRLSSLVKWGFGGKVGHGQQGMSWIHEADMNALFRRAIENEEMQGAYLATAPNPVSNEEFMRTLRASLKIPFGLPAYEWMVRVGAPLIMKTDPELGLYGRYCVSKRLKEETFVFRFPRLSEALHDLSTGKQ